MKWGRLREWGDATGALVLRLIGDEVKMAKVWVVAVMSCKWPWILETQRMIQNVLVSVHEMQRCARTCLSCQWVCTWGYHFGLGCWRSWNITPCTSLRHLYTLPSVCWPFLGSAEVHMNAARYSCSCTGELPRGMFRLNAIALVVQVFAQSKTSSAYA